MSVQISEHFGIIIRKSALRLNQLSSEELKDVFETANWFDEDDKLISAGPHFGGEASGEFVKRLEQIGLKYGDDFIDFDDLLPNWCTVSISCNPD